MARDELCRRLRVAGFTYESIGDFLNGRHWVTIIRAVSRGEERIRQALAHAEPESATAA